MVRLASLIGIMLLLQGFAQAADGPATQPAATAPASQPAVTSKTVEKDGLAMTLKLSPTTLTRYEEARFSVTFRNTSEKPLVLHDAEWFWGWNMLFTNVQTQETWQVRPLFQIKRTCIDTLLKPGEQVEVPVVLDVGSPQHFKFFWQGTPDKKPLLRAEKNPLAWLMPGTYRLTVEINLRDDGPPRNDAAYWTGKLTTEPVEFTITTQRATPAAPAH